MSERDALFLRESVRYLREVHLPRLERAVSTLPAADLWWRPHPGVISVGTILRHLSGNVRQWIVSGLGGDADHRERVREFTAPEDVDAATLVRVLRETIDAASGVIAGLDPAALAAPCTIQGMPTTPLGAVYHVVEHFSWHVGQAVWIAKARAGADHGLAFYDEGAINAARNVP